MQTSELPVNAGLEGVIVAETAISYVRGAEGDLLYRGESIDRWVERSIPEAAAGVLDLTIAESAFADALYQQGELSSAELDFVSANAQLHPMVVLQSLVPLLTAAPKATPATALAGAELQPEAAAGIAIAARLPHAMAVLIAGEPIAYPEEPDYARRFLRMLGHPAPTAMQERAFSITQILQLEHSLNAGTFVARCIASTQSSLPAAISGAFGALAGVLHGGADQAAIEMADQVGEPAAARAFVERCIADGTKVMGMGHREYKVVDPRGRYVKRLAAELTQGTPHAKTFATLEAIEAAFAAEMARRNKQLHPNLEFYKGLVYRALGVPDRAFTGLFAMARVFGYIAHVLESRKNSRIIRPAARYVGG